MCFRIQHLLPALLVSLCMTGSSLAQQPELKGKSKPPSQANESEPPEEDDSSKKTEYAFNPLQAEKEITVGNYYLKKGSYRAAVARFTEATRWNPTLAEAYLKLGEAAEKFKDTKAAKDAYSKYLELAPDAKNAAEIKKKLSKLQSAIGRLKPQPDTV